MWGIARINDRDPAPGASPSAPPVTSVPPGLLVSRFLLPCATDVGAFARGPGGS